MLCLSSKQALSGTFGTSISIPSITFLSLPLHIFVILGKGKCALNINVPSLPGVQDHYDWGLRAIKSVLVVAGSLKRGDPDRPEDQVLMRALRDFNIPKIVTDDMPVFMGLIGDLFPALDVPRKRDLEFEKHVKQSVLDLKLQAEDNFVLKVSCNYRLTRVGCFSL